MIPSVILRKKIEKKHKLHLNSYYWSKSLQADIFKISFCDGLKTVKLREIFKDGYNIGNCLLTSSYVATIFKNSSICTGKVEFLKGTKNSPNGDHVWLELDDSSIIDTTLMLYIPPNCPYHSSYNKQGSILPQFSNEDLTYQNDYYLKKHFPEKYYSEILDVI